MVFVRHACTDRAASTAKHTVCWPADRARSVCLMRNNRCGNRSAANGIKADASAALRALLTTALQTAQQEPEQAALLRQMPIGDGPLPLLPEDAASLLHAIATGVSSSHPGALGARYIPQGLPCMPL